jgi:hypothetical protein
LIPTTGPANRRLGIGARYLDHGFFIGDDSDDEDYDGDSDSDLDLDGGGLRIRLPKACQNARLGNR